MAMTTVNIPQPLENAGYSLITVTFLLTSTFYHQKRRIRPLEVVVQRANVILSGQLSDITDCDETLF